MDLHSILNRVIQTINPVTISHEPALLYATFKDSLRECSIGMPMESLINNEWWK